MKLAKRMLFNKRGSLYGAILAVTIGILVIRVNFVIFQGLYDAIVRDITDYRNGDVLVTNEDDYIDKSDSSIINWFERISYVEAAAPRLSSTAEMEIMKNGILIGCHHGMKMNELKFMCKSFEIFFKKTI